MTKFWRFLRPVFPANRVQHVSELRPKFALGPHHVSKYQIKSNQIYLPTQNMKEKKQTENQK